MMEKIKFRVEGTPIPQGSKRAFIVPNTGRAALTESSGDKHRYWRQCVSSAAKSAYSEEILKCPLKVDVLFSFIRPKSHYGTGRNSHSVKRSSPVEHTKTPDIDKLTRSILDSMTHVIYENDSQVVEIHARKQWSSNGDGAFAEIVISLLANDQGGR